MSKIHYFQRYSSVENTVTNNTLQLLARIYGYSPIVASKFLTDITGEPIDIGLEIHQQTRMGGSVPDGTILQRSFKILIEAKVDAPVDRDQLLRHASTFAGESQKLLLLLTKQPLSRSQEEVAYGIRDRFPGIVFKNITYEAICSALKGLFEPHEATMKDLAEDYVEYCNDANLFDQSRFLLRIVPCGRSVEINRKYGIYFQPSDRGYTEHAFIGIYANKSVQSILEIESAFDVELIGGRLEKVTIQGKPTNKYDTRLLGIIEAAKRVCGYEVGSGHRFFCGDMADTDYQKSSPGGIQGARFVNLREVLGTAIDSKDIASRLRKLTWE